MDFNNEETPKLNLKKERRMANTNLLPIVVLAAISVALVIFLIFIVLYNPSGVNDTKVEISLNVQDIKSEDKKSCEVSNDAIKDSQNVKLSYKKSAEKFYYGNYNDLINNDGTFKEPTEDEKRNGVDLVIENITKNIYVIVEYSSGDEDADSVKYTYDKSEKGKVIIPFNSFGKTSASVFVYADNNDCDKLLKHYDVELPKYNKLSENKKCDSDEGKVSKFCTEYTYDDYNESVLNKLSDGKTKEAVLDLKSIAIVFVLFIGAAIVIYIKLR